MVPNQVTGNQPGDPAIQTSSLGGGPSLGPDVPIGSRGEELPSPDVPLDAPIEKNYNEIPLRSSNIFSRFFIFWAWKVLITGNKQTYTKNLLYKIPADLEFENHFERFYEFYSKSRTEPNHSFRRAFLRWIGPSWIMQTIYYLFANILTIANPYCLKYILNWYNSRNEPPTVGLVLSGVIFVCAIIRAFCNTHAQNYSIDTTIMVFIVIYGIYFKKLTTASLSAIKYINVSTITTGITMDLLRINLTVQTGNQLFTAPVMSLIFIILILVEIGWPGLIGIAIVLIVMYLQYAIGKLSTTYTAKKLQQADARNKMVTNSIVGIKTIKFNAWEQVIITFLDVIRKIEKGFQQKLIFIRCTLDGLMYVMPLLSAAVSIVIYQQANNNNMNIGSMFYVITLFNAFAAPLRIFFFALINLFDAMASMDRINTFMEIPDETPEESIAFNDLSLPLGAVVLESFTASFDDRAMKEKYEKVFGKSAKPANAQKPKKKKKKQPEGEFKETEAEELNREAPKPSKAVLLDLNINAKPGQFIGVIGKVGCGKSALLKALTKTLFVQNGSYKKNGKIAYISQETFLVNGTLKNNIIFGHELDEPKYQQIIKACELLPDLAVLPGGDQTEIGERGINLSGGQKQRIAIARAVYSDSDIYLIDDSLSALDSHVGQAIFNNVFKGILSGKTLIMTTHALQYLSQLDHIIMLSSGRLLYEGRYDELLSIPEFAEFVSESIRKQSVEQLGENKNEPAKPEEAKPQKPQDAGSASGNAVQGELLKQEKRFQGHVSFQIWKEYFMIGGLAMFIINIILMCLTIGTRMVADWWVGNWSSHVDTISFGAYVGIYMGIAGVALIFTYLRGVFFSIYASQISYTMFKDLSAKIFHKTMSYFDTTPLGQIINLTSKDTDVIDLQLPNFLFMGLSYFLQMIGTFILVAVSNAILIPVVIIILVIFIFMILKFLNCATELRRLDQLANSPVISNIMEFYNGLSIFRAFMKTDFHNLIYSRNVNTLITINMHDRSLQNLINFLSDILISIAIGITFFLVCFGRIWTWDFVVSNSAYVALSLNWILSLPGLLYLMLFTIAEAARNMSSTQRMLKNVDDLELEGEWSEPPAPPGWPAQGAIEARELSIRYRPGLPLVLDHVSFKIRPKEKIGIIGRTGSGKSSLLLTLTRLLEIEGEENGSILIDDLPIHTIGLHELRKHIKVIPQDSFCLKGSLRLNVDPYETCSTDEVKEALIKAQLWNSNIFATAKRDRQDSKPKVPASQPDIPIPGSNPSIVGLKTDLKGDTIPLSASKAPLDILLTEAQPINSDLPVIALQREETVLMTSDEDKLNFEIEEGGKNLSIGQKQLLCIARAIARVPKILMMDEATSNIDPTTDLKIQEIIKKEFRSSTIVTIAHRLNTIIQYDRLLVLERGRLIESGSPLELLQRDSIFRSMVRENGKDFEEKMLRCAQNLDLSIVEEFSEVMAPDPMADPRAVIRRQNF